MNNPSINSRIFGEFQSDQKTIREVILIIVFSMHEIGIVVATWPDAVLVMIPLVMTSKRTGEYCPALRVLNLYPNNRESYSFFRTQHFCFRPPLVRFQTRHWDSESVISRC